MARAKLIVFFGLTALLVGLVISGNSQSGRNKPARSNNQELLADVSLLALPDNEPARSLPKKQVAPSTANNDKKEAVAQRSNNPASSEPPVVQVIVASPPSPTEVNFPGSTLLSEAELWALAEKNQNSSNPNPEPDKSADPEPTSPPTPEPTLNILISEIQLTGGAGKTQEDFIELYNPNQQAIDLSGWKIKKRTKTGSESSLGTFDPGSAIPGNGFFLWANSNNGFAERIEADMARTYSIAGNNSIALFNSEGDLVDAVAWGSDLTDPFGEGSPLLVELEANQSYERRVSGGCNRPTDEGELLGNGCDTGDNRADFMVRTVSRPQNTKSPKEPQ